MNDLKMPKWFDDNEDLIRDHYIACAQHNINLAAASGQPAGITQERLERLKAHFAITPQPPLTPLPVEPPPPVVAGRARYVLFSDMGGDPDDQQSLRRLMFYPEITPDIIIPQNGEKGVTQVIKAIQEYTLDYPKLKEKRADFKDPNHWLSAIQSSPYSTLDTDFSDIQDSPLTDAEQTFVNWADAFDGDIHCWVWGPATEIAHILWKRLDLGARMVIISIGAWNKEQDRSAHNWLKAATDNGHVKLWVNMDSKFRAMYCGLRDNRKFVTEDIKRSGALGKGYYDISEEVNTGAYTIKEGDTPTFLFSLFYEQCLKGEDCPLGNFKKVNANRWDDDFREAGDICGYRATASFQRNREAVRQDFKNRLTWLK